MDPETYHYPARVGLAVQLLSACDWHAPRLGSVSTPLLIFHSERDT